MADLPVMLRVRHRLAVVVGGGAVALRRAGALLACDARVKVVAKALDERFLSMPVEKVEREYQLGDLDGAFLVVIATDHAGVNQRVADDASAAGVLVNRADEPDAGDFTVPAHTRHGPVTIAVHTGGASATAAAAIRRELSDHLDPDWVVMLEMARPVRQLIQDRFDTPEQRRARLLALTSPEAMAVLKAEGRPGLERFYARLTDAACPPPTL